MNTYNTDLGADSIMDKDIVIYKGKRYKIIYKYHSGYYEIKRLDKNYIVELVHHSELDFV